MNEKWMPYWAYEKGLTLEEYHNIKKKLGQGQKLMEITRKQLDDYAKYQRKMWGNTLKCYSLWDWLAYGEQGQ